MSSVQPLVSSSTLREPNLPICTDLLYSTLPGNHCVRGSEQDDENRRKHETPRNSQAALGPWRAHFQHYLAAQLRARWATTQHRILHHATAICKAWPVNLDSLLPTLTPLYYHSPRQDLYQPETCAPSRVIGTQPLCRLRAGTRCRRPTPPQPAPRRHFPAPFALASQPPACGGPERLRLSWRPTTAPGFAMRLYVLIYTPA